MIRFTNPQHVGPYLPHFWDEADPRPAKEQADTAYPFGGWQSFKGFTLSSSIEQRLTGPINLCYPGDPPMPELSRAKLRDETIILFPSDWVVILQPDFSFEVSRMD